MKRKKYLLFLLIIPLITIGIYLVRLAAPIKLSDDSSVLTVNNKNYTIRTSAWTFIETNKLIGRINDKLGILTPFFPIKVYSLVGDEEGYAYYENATLSEFGKYGGTLYFRDDLYIPEFSNIVSNRIELKDLFILYEEAEMYVFTEDKLLINDIMNIIKGMDKQPIQNIDTHMLNDIKTEYGVYILCLFSDQLPGCVYKIGIDKNADNHFIINDNYLVDLDGSDVTNAIYQLLSRGEMVIDIDSEGSVK